MARLCICTRYTRALDDNSVRTLCMHLHAWSHSAYCCFIWAFEHLRSKYFCTLSAFISSCVFKYVQKQMDHSGDVHSFFVFCFQVNSSELKVDILRCTLRAPLAVAGRLTSCTEQLSKIKCPSLSLIYDRTAVWVGRLMAVPRNMQQDLYKLNILNTWVCGTESFI